MKWWSSWTDCSQPKDIEIISSKEVVVVVEEMCHRANRLTPPTSRCRRRLSGQEPIDDDHCEDDFVKLSESSLDSVI